MQPIEIPNYGLAYSPKFRLKCVKSCDAKQKITHKNSHTFKKREKKRLPRDFQQISNQMIMGIGNCKQVLWLIFIHLRKS